MDNLKDAGYIELITFAKKSAKNRNLPMVLLIRDEINRRIDNKKSVDKNPSWGSLMAFYEIVNIIENIE